jgi:PPOX class probable F420-dependent enzyme
VNLSDSQARSLLAGARVARLATAGADGHPHLVPVTFAVDGDRIYIAIDHKPKTTTTGLKRLRNIQRNPRVSLLADHYDEDWTTLWWVRVDGWAGIVTPDTKRLRPISLLTSKYAQYEPHPPSGPVIEIEARNWVAWASSPRAVDPPSGPPA